MAQMRGNRKQNWKYYGKLTGRKMRTLEANRKMTDYAKYLRTLERLDLYTVSLPPKKNWKIEEISECP